MSEGNEVAGLKRFRVHPLDLLLLLLALGLGALAFARLFRESPLPLPADRLLGAEIVAEFAADREWKAGFPAEGERVRIEDALFAEVRERTALPGPRVRLRLRIQGRDLQRPDALVRFRRVLRRGAVVTLSERESEVAAEILEVIEPGAPR